jgi:hypothetical protein
LEREAAAVAEAKAVAAIATAAAAAAKMAAAMAAKAMAKGKEKQTKKRALAGGASASSGSSSVARSSGPVPKRIRSAQKKEIIKPVVKNVMKAVLKMPGSRAYKEQIYALKEVKEVNPPAGRKGLTIAPGIDGFDNYFATTGGGFFAARTLALDWIRKEIRYIEGTGPGFPVSEHNPEIDGRRREWYQPPA